METTISVKVVVEVAAKNKKTGGSIDKESDGKTGKISDLHRITDGFVQYVGENSIVIWSDDFKKGRILDWNETRWICRRFKNYKDGKQKKDHQCSPNIPLPRNPDVAAVESYFKTNHKYYHMRDHKKTILKFKDGTKLDLASMADTLLMEEQIRREESGKDCLAGAGFHHAIVNRGAERLVFKIESLNNNEYRVKPVVGFVEPGGTTNVEITRLRGDAKSDKMVVHFATCPADAVDPTATFATATPAGQAIIHLEIA